MIARLQLALDGIESYNLNQLASNPESAAGRLPLLSASSPQDMPENESDVSSNQSFLDATIHRIAARSMAMEPLNVPIF